MEMKLAMAGAVDASWFARRTDHEQAAHAARGVVRSGPMTKRVRRATEVFVDDDVHHGGLLFEWPRHNDTNAPKPPDVTPALVRAISRESAVRHPDQPYGPASALFIQKLATWQGELKRYFEHSRSCFANNTRAAAHRIEARVSFLPCQRVHRIMRVVRQGYRIPFTAEPQPFHRPSNSPDLKQL